MGEHYRKVALVGSSDTTRHLAPYDDPSWEIWTLNDMCVLGLSRIDRYFELHTERCIMEDVGGNKIEREWLVKNQTVPVFMHYPLDWVPKRVQYPTEEIRKEYDDYFTSSMAWMIALAIYEEVDEIGIWGIDMAHTSEYAHQRACFEYFMGIAKGKNIPIYIPPQCMLLKSRVLYGLQEDDFTVNLRQRKANLQAQKDQVLAIKMNALVDEAKCQGALENLDYMILWYGDSNGTG